MSERDDTSFFGFSRVATAEKQGRVDAVFHSVARRYDLMNDLMSGGLHRLWKDAAVSWLSPPRSGRIAGRPYRLLDMAGGTGDIAFRVAGRTGGKAEITVGDINASMLGVGRDRSEQRAIEGVSFLGVNAEALPFADARFDAYTIAFGIRNVPRMAVALAEARRVLKPGGRFLCLEFSQVDAPFLDALYERYSMQVIPALGGLVAGDRDSYRYLVESIRTFPNQERFKGAIERAGFSRVAYRNLTGGVAAIHSGWAI